MTMSYERARELGVVETREEFEQLVATHDRLNLKCSLADLELLAQAVMAASRMVRVQHEGHFHVVQGFTRGEARLSRPYRARPMSKEPFDYTAIMAKAKEDRREWLAACLAMGWHPTTFEPLVGGPVPYERQRQGVQRGARVWS